MVFKFLYRNTPIRLPQATIFKCAVIGDWIEFRVEKSSQTNRRRRQQVQSCCFYSAFVSLFSFFYIMVAANRAVIGCANNNRKLQKWKETIWEEHVGQENGKYACQPLPFVLFLPAKIGT